MFASTEITINLTEVGNFVNNIPAVAWMLLYSILSYIPNTLFFRHKLKQSPAICKHTGRCTDRGTVTDYTVAVAFAPIALIGVCFYLILKWPMVGFWRMVSHKIVTDHTPPSY